MRKGFTLIELLVVVTIIAVIATAVLVNIVPSSLKRARDTERKSNLKQYQTALESYANNNTALYPSAGTQVSVTTLCANSSSALYNYMSKCINDKKAGFTYTYTSDTLKWVLTSYLELSKNYWIVCSNGKSGTTASIGSITNGVCPL
jgi:prepilin-type N-terminal cleavage/methylation domain-containing protein